MLIIKQPANIKFRAPVISKVEQEPVETCRTLRRAETAERRTRARCSTPVCRHGAQAVRIDFFSSNKLT